MHFQCAEPLGQLQQKLIGFSEKGGEEEEKRRAQKRHGKDGENSGAEAPLKL